MNDFYVFWISLLSTTWVKLIDMVLQINSAFETFVTDVARIPLDRLWYD